MEFTQSELKTTIKVIQGVGLDASYFNKLLVAKVEKDNMQAEIDKWTEYSTEECPTLDVFESWCQEELHERVLESTPHGEYGLDSYTGYFKWDDREWLATYSPDWNRYDKRFYYIDNCGNNISVVEI